MRRDVDGASFHRECKAWSDLLRFFAGFQALGALFEIWYAMGAAEMPVTKAAEHKGHFNPVFRFAVVTVFCGSCLRHGPSPRIILWFKGRIIA